MRTDRLIFVTPPDRTNAMLQIAIFILSFAAICMLNVPGPWQRWAPVVGILSQPFWMVATWRANQWGMLLLAFFYCVPWTVGIVHHFF